MKKVEIYCDGACSGNPGPGGWAAVLLYKNAKKEISGYEPDTTNNRMELTAAISALKLLKEQCVVDVYTDSAYVFNAFSQKWIYGWQKNNWVTSTKKPVSNKELWLELTALCKTHSVSWNKVKGHSSNELNNRCDELARAAIKAHSSDVS